MKSSFALLCAFLLLLGCDQTNENPVEAILVAEEKPSQEAWDVVFNVSQDGNDLLEVKAPYMARFEKNDSLYVVLSGSPDSTKKPVRVQVNIFDETGNIASEIKSSKVYYFENVLRFSAKGNVVVTTSNGKKLESQEMVWNHQSKRINAPGFVRITTPTEQIQGYDLDASQDLEFYNFYRVTGQVYVQDF